MSALIALVEPALDVVSCLSAPSCIIIQCLVLKDECDDSDAPYLGVPGGSGDRDHFMIANKAAISGTATLLGSNGGGVSTVITT